MTWVCLFCGSSNVWWRNHCENCARTVERPDHYELAKVYEREGRPDIAESIINFETEPTGPKRWWRKLRRKR